MNELINAFPTPIGVVDFDNSMFEEEIKELLEVFEEASNEEEDEFFTTEENLLDSNIYCNVFDREKYQKIVDFFVENLMTEYFLKLEVKNCSRMSWGVINKIKKGNCRNFNKTLDSTYAIIFPLTCGEDQTVDIYNPNAILSQVKIRATNPNIYNSRVLSLFIKDKAIIIPASTMYEIKCKDDTDFIYGVIGLAT